MERNEALFFALIGTAGVLSTVLLAVVIFSI